MPLRKTGEQFQWKSRDGLTLHARKWPARDDAKLRLIIVHGIGEHSGRYRYLISYLNDHNVEVLAFDNRGHGLSEGARGHIDCWDDYRQDLKDFVERSKEQRPHLPLFVLGHSFGSLIVLDYILRYPEGLAGAVISASALQPINVATTLQIWVARMMAIVAPRFILKLNIDPNLLSRIKEMCDAYRNDPLVFDQATARWGVESLKVINRIESHAGDLAIPVLFIHGGEDGLNAVKGTEDFFHKVVFPDKQLIIYPGRFHEPHNDLGQEQVADDLVCWLKQHIKEPAGK